jgi:hypothetical protein
MFQGYRGWWVLGLSVWAIASAAILALIITLNWYQQNADYPGAVLMNADTSIRYSPQVSVRRESNFRSTDSLTQILQWYSNELGLSNVSRGQGRCISAFKTFTSLYIIGRRVSVSLCETFAGQYITVRRSWFLQLP